MVWESPVGATGEWERTDWKAHEQGHLGALAPFRLSRCCQEASVKEPTRWIQGKLQNYNQIQCFYFKPLSCAVMIFKLLIWGLNHIWNKSPIQVRCTILDAWGWCTGTTQRGWYGEGGGRRVQDGERVYTCGGFMLKYGKTNTIL